ncbi:MAG: hypothetical protein L6420_04425 [Elusimicrobia bacterium]|nr:hypothetical protein [Elusimicrobiota bacterium]
MRRMIMSVIMVLAFGLKSFAATAEQSKIFTPYFDMILSEGAFVPSEGDFFSGGNINTQVGLLSKINEENSIFGIYNFNYSGPGFQPQDAGQFSERTMGHSFNIEYRRKLNDRFRIRQGISYGIEYKRAGANEAWENGLYNTNSLGFKFASDYSFDFNRNGIVTLEYLQRNIEFPNYTDLLLEFQGAGSSSELSGGLQDQQLRQISLRTGWNKFFGGITYTLQKFKNQRVVDNNGTGGGIYGDALQKDKNSMLDFGYHHTLWIFEMAPVISYSWHKSNQNFVRYKFLGDTAPDFIAGNYDYNELNLTVPLDLLITGRWSISGALSMVKRNYTDRPARDSNNTYTSSKQSNTLTTLSGGIRKKMNDIATVRISYSLVVGSSNNKFERYLPYNYTGNSLGVAYQLSY